MAKRNAPMRVLVPVDRSGPSEAALEEALEQFPEAEIHVLHVLQVKTPWGEDTKAGGKISVDEGKEILDSAKSIAADHGRDLETEMVEGNAAKTIVSYAEENDIDRIVMGSVGRSGVSRLLLGSVAEAVTRRAPCSVTIVRE